MELVTPEQMRQMDARAISEGGIPGVVLMENAGRAVTDEILARFGAVRGKNVHIYCGTGNNGGDGFVITRLLHLAGAHVGYSIFGDLARLSSDSKTHYEILLRTGLYPSEPIIGQDFSVDCVLGTGLTGAPRQEQLKAIQLMNATGKPVVAVDIPSGVNGWTGETEGEAVRAWFTVTFAYPKVGLYLPPGADFTGDVVVRNIGFNWKSLLPAISTRLQKTEDIAPLFPRRISEGHKGMYGHVLIVGGSCGMSGAVVMAAEAALRAGAGLVTVAAPACAQPIIAGRLAEVMTIALEDDGEAVVESAWDQLAHAVKSCDVVCLGPGITCNHGAQAFVLRALEELDRPLILDADGLNALADNPHVKPSGKYPWILTPHPGECARLLGVSTSDIQHSRLSSVRRCSAKYHAVTVLKGARTLICDGAGDNLLEDNMPVTFNTTGNPGMATGGAGDTLTGIIGALLARKIPPYPAACAGVYLHGRAGDLAAERVGETGLIAGDIAHAVPYAIRELEGF